MKAYWGSRSIAALFDFGINWKWSSLRPRRFSPREKAPWYPLDRRLDEPQSCSGRGGEEKNSQPPTGNRTLEPLSFSL
jgi:hypothetical protein